MKSPVQTKDREAENMNVPREYLVKVTVTNGAFSFSSCSSLRFAAATVFSGENSYVESPWMSESERYRSHSLSPE